MEYASPMTYEQFLVQVESEKEGIYKAHFKKNRPTSVPVTKKIKDVECESNILGSDPSANGLLKILSEMKNTCISYTRYEDLLKIYKTEKNFLKELYNLTGIKFSIRYVGPEKEYCSTLTGLFTVTVTKIPGRISKNDKGYYVIEEIKNS